MIPNAVNCFSPKFARIFLNSWARKNDFKYNFFSTPKGPLVFYKDDQYYICKRWVGLKFVAFNSRESFLTNLAEELAIAFGWKNHEDNIKTIESNN